MELYRRYFNPARAWAHEWITTGLWRRRFTTVDARFFTLVNNNGALEEAL